jgi:hypothetical protein
MHLLSREPTSDEVIPKLCRESCHSDHFVLFDVFKEISPAFMSDIISRSAMYYE